MLCMDRVSGASDVCVRSTVALSKRGTAIRRGVRARCLRFAVTRAESARRAPSWHRVITVHGGKTAIVGLPVGKMKAHLLRRSYDRAFLPSTSIVTVILVVGRLVPVW